MKIRRLLFASGGPLQIAVCLVPVLLALSASAAEAKTSAPLAPIPVVGPTSSSGPSDPAELEAFLDSIIEPQMQQAHIAGATLAVVRDGKILLTKGYGYADVAQSTPVRAETTLFQIGSMTKLFTWTAVMQLVEQGKLDLDVDINAYLDFTIPTTYPQPITLKHLMSHTPGFEDISFAMFPARLEQIQPLGQHLAGHMPARVRPPGLISAYSNYGTDLAGYVVERVSGLAYEEYIEKNIFQPLGMEHTAVRQPLPPNLATDMSLGYRYVNGSLQAQPTQWIADRPAGVISATASDMARFMIAHLQDGRYGEARILKEQTARQMHSTLFRMDERVNGFAYGFFERDMNGQRMIGHSGSTLMFNGDLVLLPEQNLGLFVSFNSYSAAGVVEPLVMRFMDQYYPMEQNAIPAGFASRTDELTGVYRLTRMSYTTAEKIKGLLLCLELTATPDGTLHLDVTQSRLLPIAPLLFREEKYGIPVVFRPDANGHITHLLLGNRPDQTFEKLAWFETPIFHYGLLLICTVLFLSVVVLAVAGWLIRRFQGTKAHPLAPKARAARGLLAIVAALNLVALLDFVVIFVGNFEALESAVTKGEASIMYLPLLLWLVAAIATVGVVVFMILAWKNRYWNVLARVHYTSVTGAALVFIWFLNYWNLLGWRL